MNQLYMYVFTLIYIIDFNFILSLQPLIVYICKLGSFIVSDVASRVTVNSVIGECNK